MEKARAKRKKRATEGLGYYFHGGFKDKAKAIAKARKVGGFAAHKRVRSGDWRWVVMSGRAPF